MKELKELKMYNSEGKSSMLQTAHCPLLTVDYYKLKGLKKYNSKENLHPVDLPTETVTATGSEFWVLGSEFSTEESPGIINNQIMTHTRWQRWRGWSNWRCSIRRKITRASIVWCLPGHWRVLYSLFFIRYFSGFWVLSSVRREIRVSFIIRLW